jgi:hypothetical protein
VIAALYVETEGCYADIPGVDAWDEARDARRYAGPWPVVAHPPCTKWINLALVNYSRWGGEHNRPDEDGGCFAAALSAVREFGGVLEHPAQSRAFRAHGIAPPTSIGWQRTFCGGWVCEVWQSAYGHRASKRTWLYAHGCTPPPLNWSRPVGECQVGYQDRRGRDRNKPTLGRREAMATPAAFRDALIGIAKLTV